MATMRAMTYNIFMGGRRRRDVRWVVRASAPDVLLVNESPKLPLLWRCRCRTLVRSWGMTYVGGGRDAGSNLIAVSGRVRVRTVWTEVLDQPLFKPRRGIASAQLRLDGRLFGVVSCHLSLDRASRAREVERVVAAADRMRGSVIVAGDLNEKAGGPSWQRLRQAGFVDHGTAQWLTFPASEPDRRIDALLVRGDVVVRSHGDPGVPLDLQSRASDHRAVSAVLDLG